MRSASAASIQKELDPARLVMRSKLPHAQQVLEGLTLENYDLIAQHAQSMSLLSLEASWRPLLTERYLEHGPAFPRVADRLARPANVQDIHGPRLRLPGIEAAMRPVPQVLRGHQANPLPS